MTNLTADIERVWSKVEAELGGDPEGWTRWPGGWPNDIEAALIDAVYWCFADERGVAG